MNSFFISIITVVFNDLEGMTLTYESVMQIKNLHKNVEFVIIDGGSTDGTKAYLESNQKDIDVLISEKDRGIYDAMNKGLDHSNGQLVTFLNAGDFYKGNVFEKIVEVHDYLIPVKVIDAKSQYYAKIKPYYLGTPYSHQGIVFRRRPIRFKLEYSISADLDYILEAGLDFRSLGDNYSTYSGYVAYDNAGTSNIHFWSRDRQIMTILHRHQKILSALIFSVLALIKWPLKKILALS